MWQPVDNSQLVLFRVLFGLVMLFELVITLAYGWVRLSYLDIQHNFTFIGFEWLGILHGPGMYYYYYVMLLCAVFVTLGLAYRYSAVLLAVLWTGFYFSQKTHYNNHYYLLMLLCWFMVFMPANRRFSLDVKWKLVRPLNECRRWQIQLFIFQVACVYLFAAVAKLNADWLHAIPLTVWMQKKAGIPHIGRFLKMGLTPWLIAYGGLLFDLLVVPGLLYRRTRNYFFLLSLVFHVLNYFIFRIGSFPFLALSLDVFFFPAAFFSRFIPFAKEAVQLADRPAFRKVTSTVIALYIALQLWLPLRHLLLPGSVSWTEEGHRMSWRMMLRSKRGTAFFKVKDRKTDSTWIVYPASFLHSSQLDGEAVFPDLTWQAAQYLKEQYQKQGRDVRIYAHNEVSLNFRQPRLLIDTTYDLASEKWHTWRHNKWVIIYKD